MQQLSVTALSLKRVGSRLTLVHRLPSYNWVPKCSPLQMNAGVSVHDKKESFRGMGVTSPSIGLLLECTCSDIALLRGAGDGLPFETAFFLGGSGGLRRPESDTVDAAEDGRGRSSKLDARVGERVSEGSFRLVESWRR
jgi:hypothetical protein